MPVFSLPDTGAVFPNPELAEADGLLALGGNLSPRSLVVAYSQGIFPWYSENTPILWWAPDPRCVLFPEEFHQPKSLKKVLNQQQFSCTFDTAFAEVINACATEHPGGTWLLDERIEAYIQLHSMHLAHSIEVWHKGVLAGGVYGVSLGRAFFAESMFFRVPNASKIALVYLVNFATENNFLFIDCQQETEHMLRFGARGIPRNEFMGLLEQALIYPTLRSLWTGPLENSTG